MEMQEENLEYDVNIQLVDYGVKRISTIEGIDEIYDYEMLIVSNDLVVRDETKINIILFDTPTQSSAFLMETYSKYVDEFGEPFEHVIVSYCDEVSVYDALFKKYFLLSETEYKGNCEIPIILVINGIDDEILIEQESFTPIGVEVFSNIFNEIN